MSQGAHPTTLYRFYDPNDRLLYVGISERGPERWRAHRKEKPWWTEVARTTTHHYDSRHAALEAERAAIIAEQPAYNVVHNGARSKRTASPPAHDITWRCAHCHNLIDDGDGYVWTRPNRGIGQPWIATHRRCDPEIEVTGYWIGVERIRSHHDYENWVDHLSHKVWFDGADFHDACFTNLVQWANFRRQGAA